MNATQKSAAPRRGRNSILPISPDADASDPKIYLTWTATVRFLAEVHRLEQEGYVGGSAHEKGKPYAKGRLALEESLHLFAGAINRMRTGYVVVGVADIMLLGGKYGGDVSYITTGMRNAADVLRRQLRRPRFEGYHFPYRTAPHPALLKLAEQLDKEKGAAILGLVDAAYLGSGATDEEKPDAA